MTDKEYRAFLAYLYREYMEPRLARVRERWRSLLHHGKLGGQQRTLRSATRLFRFAYRECSGPDEVFDTFKRNRLVIAVAEVRTGVRLGKELAEEAGVLDCLDSHYDQIVAGLQPEHLPSQEAQVLSDLGSSEPNEDIKGIVYMLKCRREAGQQHWSDKPLLRHQLEGVEEQLGCEGKSLRSENRNSSQEPPIKNRGWFKGVGQIGQGAALTIANVGLAVGAFEFTVSPETQTWGALTSATTGVGLVLTGVGEFRGE